MRPNGNNFLPANYQESTIEPSKAKQKVGEFGALEWTRTTDPQLRKLMLYPLSYEREKQNYTPKLFAARHHNAPNERLLAEEKQHHERHAHQGRGRHNQVPLVIVLTLVKPQSRLQSQLVGLV